MTIIFKSDLFISRWCRRPGVSLQRALNINYRSRSVRCTQEWFHIDQGGSGERDTFPTRCLTSSLLLYAIFGTSSGRWICRSGNAPFYIASSIRLFWLTLLAEEYPGAQEVGRRLVEGSWHLGIEQRLLHGTLFPSVDSSFWATSWPFG